MLSRKSRKFSLKFSSQTGIQPGTFLMFLLVVRCTIHNTTAPFCIHGIVSVYLQDNVGNDMVSPKNCLTWKRLYRKNECQYDRNHWLIPYTFFVILIAPKHVKIITVECVPISMFDRWAIQALMILLKASGFKIFRSLLHYWCYVQCSHYFWLKRLKME